LEDYVSVYQEAIDGLNLQIADAQADFEIVSEEKRLREEQEAAAAAQKAKENEYGDMRIAVDEAKEYQDEAQAKVDRLTKWVEECNRMSNNVDAPPNTTWIPYGDA